MIRRACWRSPRLHGQERDSSWLGGLHRCAGSGSMAWDKAGEGTRANRCSPGSPTDARGREVCCYGDREDSRIIPVAGHFRMDTAMACLLTTPTRP